MQGGPQWGVLSTNILWKIPQRQHTAVDIGRRIAAVRVLIRAGKHHSCSFLPSSQTQVYDCGARLVGFINQFGFIHGLKKNC